MYGAQGGGRAGGLGGEVTATMAVKPGEVLMINVGGKPGPTVLRVFGGYNGGGAGGTRAGHLGISGDGGGGASDVRRGSFRLRDRLLVGVGVGVGVGGGGGGGGSGFDRGGGGSGGGRVGLTGHATTTPDGFGGTATCGGGSGGTQTVGGAGGRNCFQGSGRKGRLGDGGKGGWGYLFFLAGSQTINGPTGGGGGGGGLYGGGGGAGAGLGIPSGPGGGGGSSFGPPVAAFRTGVRHGSGLVTVTYTRNCSRGAPCVRRAPGPP